MKHRNLSATTEWKTDFKARLTREIARGDYRKGLEIARQGLKSFPEDFDCRFQYAKLLGDWADELPPAKKKRFKSESLEILRPLLRRLRGMSAESRFSVCLNFYYQSEAFLPMVAWGKRLRSRRDRAGWYAIGLGSSLEAYRLFKEGKHRRAKAWALKSIRAWKAYDLSEIKYYFPHYILALAYAVSGDRSLGLNKISTAARLSKRKIDDWEFADALALLRPRAIGKEA